MLHAGQATAPCRRLTSGILLCAGAACAVGLSAAGFSCGTLPTPCSASCRASPRPLPQADQLHPAVHRCCLHCSTAGSSCGILPAPCSACAGRPTCLAADSSCRVAACSARRRVERHDEFDCTLCSNLLHQPITTPCGHSFCRLCFQRAFDHSNKCPLCRTVRPASLWCAAPAVHCLLCRTGRPAWLECAGPRLHCLRGCTVRPRQALVCCAHSALSAGFADTVFLLRLLHRVPAGAATLRACWGVHPSAC